MNAGCSYQEVSRRHGDFALAGAAAVLALDADGCIHHARLTLTGTTPMRARKAEEFLLGQRPSEALFRDAARRATENLEQDSDIHASAEYRRDACAALARRALAQAAQRAAEQMKGTAAMSTRQVRLTINGREYTGEENRASFSPISCVTISDSRAPTWVASTAFAALARSYSMASRCAPACFSPCKRTALI